MPLSNRKCDARAAALGPALLALLISSALASFHCIAEPVRAALADRGSGAAQAIFRRKRSRSKSHQSTAEQRIALTPAIEGRFGCETDTHRLYGLTSAATIWACGLIGACIGSGYYFIAFMGLLGMMLALYVDFDHFVRKKLGIKSKEDINK